MKIINKVSELFEGFNSSLARTFRACTRKKSFWHYGLMKHCKGYYAVHEIYFSGKKNEMMSWTSQAIDIGGGSKKEILSVLEKIKQDIMFEPIRDYKTGKVV